jgi:hypothetical protein
VHALTEFSGNCGAFVLFFFSRKFPFWMSVTPFFFTQCPPDFSPFFFFLLHIAYGRFAVMAYIPKATPPSHDPGLPAYSPTLPGSNKTKAIRDIVIRASTPQPSLRVPPPPCPRSPIPPRPHPSHPDTPLPSALHHLVSASCCRAALSRELDFSLLNRGERVLPGCGI